MKIINGPENTKVNFGETAKISCGFTGASANFTIPDWLIKEKNALGIFSTKLISSSEITNNHRTDLRWDVDWNNATNSKLLVGPVNGAHNDSTYQCIISFSGGSINSSTAILIVIGEIF